MLSDSSENKKNNPLQPLSNGFPQNPLQRLSNKLLHPFAVEINIEKCKNNIVLLKQSTTGIAYSENDKQLLLTYYRQRLTYYQNKLNTLNAWFIEVSSPNYL